MKETTIKIAPVKIEMTPAFRALSERIENPQDLNDALLAVRVEEHARRTVVLLNARISDYIKKAFGAPWE